MQIDTLRTLFYIFSADTYQHLFDLRFAIVFIILGSIAIISYLIFSLKQKGRQLDDAAELLKTRQTHYDFFKGLIDHCPAKWLIWTPSENRFLIDPRLATYLQFSDVHEITLKQLSNCFLPHDAELMNNKLSSLSEKGEGFDLKLNLLKGKSSCTFIASSNPSGPLNSYVIWFRETFEPAELSGQALSNKFLSGLLNALPIPIWARDKQGNLTYCNRYYSEILETNPAQVIRDNLNLFQGELKKVSDTQRTLNEHTIIDGTRCYLSFHERTIEGQKENIGYAFDKTDVEKLEKDLERHIAGHSEVLEHISAGVVVYDIEKRVSFFNHAYARMFDIDPTWLHSRPLITDHLDLLHKRRMLVEHADFPAFKQRTLQMFTSLITPVQELLHLPDERTIRKVMAPHPGGGLLSIFEDVTDSLIIQRQANTQLAVQKETLDHLHEGVAVFASDNRLKLINPAFARIWRLSREFTEPGLHISLIIDQLKDYFDYGQDWEAYRQKIIANVTDRIPKNGRLTRTDDSVLEFTYVPLPDGAHLISYSDVSDSYRAERALRERNEALETADRIKSEFLHNFSFDLKAPINTVIGFSEILSDQYFGTLNTQQETYCKGILDASHQLLTLVNDIMDLATIEAGKMHLTLQPVDPKTLLSSVASMVKKGMKRQQLTLTVACEADLSDFIADERRLKQALINLIHNSIKFTQPGGKISLAANRIGQNIHLTVSDTGVGIARKDQKRIFRKFERTVEAIDRYEGMGLGLSLVKSLIELHGGRIMISSKHKSGTKVTCVIPSNLQQTPQPKLPNIA